MTARRACAEGTTRTPSSTSTRIPRSEARVTPTSSWSMEVTGPLPLAMADRAAHVCTEGLRATAAASASAPADTPARMRKMRLALMARDRAGYYPAG